MISQQLVNGRLVRRNVPAQVSSVSKPSLSMCDLFLITQLLRSPLVRENKNRDLSPPRQLGFGELFECIIARAAYPCDAIAIAFILLAICLKSIKSRTDVASVFGTCRKWF